MERFLENRRQFIKSLTATTVAGFALPSMVAAADSQPSRPDPKRFCAFDKPLMFLNYEETADLLASAGFSGIETAVRADGHVKPERVEEDLPKFVEALRKCGLQITILATDINNVSQRHAEKVLRTAAKLGLRQYRLFWWSYDQQRPIWQQRENLKPVLRDIVAMNREVGISALYENHSGASYVGASLWDIYELIKDYSPTEVGIAYDVMHAQVEAGLAWPLQFKLIKSHLQAVYVKDFQWEKNSVKMVPLGTGRLDAQIFKLLQEASFTGPVSLHVEYNDKSRDRTFFQNAFKTDLSALQQQLKPR